MKISMIHTIIIAALFMSAQTCAMVHCYQDIPEDSVLCEPPISTIQDDLPLLEKTIIASNNPQAIITAMNILIKMAIWTTEHSVYNSFYFDTWASVHPTIAKKYIDSTNILCEKMETFAPPETAIVQGAATLQQLLSLLNETNAMLSADKYDRTIYKKMNHITISLGSYLQDLGLLNTQHQSLLMATKSEPSAHPFPLKTIKPSTFNRTLPIMAIATLDTYKNYSATIQQSLRAYTTFFKNIIPILSPETGLNLEEKKHYYYLAKQDPEPVLVSDEELKEISYENREHSKNNADHAALCDCMYWMALTTPQEDASWVAQDCADASLDTIRDIAHKRFGLYRD